jgi:hypothetical protein
MQQRNNRLSGCDVRFVEVKQPFGECGPATWGGRLGSLDAWGGDLYLRDLQRFGDGP